MGDESDKEVVLSNENSNAPGVISSKQKFDVFLAGRLLSHTN